MQPVTARANLLDASALVKLVIDEDRHEKLRDYLKREGVWYTTAFCFYEALGVLKRKRLKKEVSEDEYRRASFGLMAEYRATSNVYDLDLTDPSIFVYTQDLASKHNIDLSDAFQLTSIIKGCPFIGESRTILITDDKCLAKAASTEGCRVWHLPDARPI